MFISDLSVDERLWAAVWAERGLPDPAGMSVEAYMAMVDSGQWIEGGEKRWPRAVAMPVAEALVKALMPGCRRIIIAGSLRRMLPDVGDIEIVCEPNSGEWSVVSGQQLGLGQAEQINLDDCLRELLIQGALARGDKNGERMKNFIAREGIKVDMFIVRPPAQWGAIVALRTGPREFMKWLVTTQAAGGAMPAGMRMEQGGLWRGSTQIITDAEDEFFRALGLAYELPESRVAGRNRMLTDGER